MMIVDEYLMPFGMSLLSVVVALLSAALALLMAKTRSVTTLAPVLFGVWMWGAVIAPAVATWLGWPVAASVVLAFVGAFIVPMLVLDPMGTVDKVLNTAARVFPWIKPQSNPPPPE